MAEITSIPPFDLFKQTGSVSPLWDRRKTPLQYYINARRITVDNHKRALLLHLVGPAVQDIFATLSDTGTTNTEVLTAPNTHFSPQKSLQFERHTFHQAHQVPNESIIIAQYVTRLRRLGEHCDFDKYSLDEAIKDQLIEHCHSITLRQRLLHEKSTASLSSLLDIARSMEAAKFWECFVPGMLGKRSPELTMPTISEEEQVNFTSEKRQQCTHCSNQRDHQPQTPIPGALLFVRHVLRAESYTILDAYVWKEPQIQVTRMANRQRYPRPGTFLILQMRMNVMRHFISTLPKQKQTSQLPLKVPQFKFVLILVQQRTPLTIQQ